MSMHPPPSRAIRCPWSRCGRSREGANLPSPAHVPSCDPSLRRWQWPHRPCAGALGAVSTRFRYPPHLPDRRILLGGAAAPLRSSRRGIAGRGRLLSLAGMRRRALAANPGTGVAAHPGAECREAGQAGAAPLAGAAPPPAPYPREHGSCRDLERVGRFPPRSDGSPASIARCRGDRRSWRHEDRSSFIAPSMRLLLLGWGAILTRLSRSDLTRLLHLSYGNPGNSLVPAPSPRREQCIALSRQPSAPCGYSLPGPPACRGRQRREPHPPGNHPCAP